MGGREIDPAEQMGMILTEVPGFHGPKVPLL